MFTPRLTRPEAGNKYYIRRQNGGYSTAILGKPTDPGCNTLANCVGYGVGRFHEIADCPEFNLIDPVNAENLFANAQQHGLRTGQEPELGALIVWKKGATLSGNDGAGHVAVVEKIMREGDVVMIVTSESGYGAAKPFWVTTRRAPFPNGDGYTLLGFVYQPKKCNPYPVPTRVLREGCIGQDVKWLQWELIERGYMRKNELDGDFGLITFCGVCGYQVKTGLEPDGVCGPATRASLSK